MLALTFATSYGGWSKEAHDQCPVSVATASVSNDSPNSCPYILTTWPSLVQDGMDTSQMAWPPYKIDFQSSRLGNLLQLICEDRHSCFSLSILALAWAQYLKMDWSSRWQMLLNAGSFKQLALILIAFFLLLVVWLFLIIQYKVYCFLCYPPFTLLFAPFCVALQVVRGADGWGSWLVHKCTVFTMESNEILPFP